MATQIKPIQRTSPAYYSPSKPEEEEVSFAQWFSRQFSNDDFENELPVQTAEIPFQALASSEDMFVLMQEQEMLTDRPPENPYEKVAESPDERQYFFDFIERAPMQGTLLNQKI